MKKQLICTILSIIMLLSLMPLTSASGNNSSVLIYETYVAGGYHSGTYDQAANSYGNTTNPAPYQNSYVVLYNNSDQDVDLEGWSLIYATGKTNKLIEAKNTVALTGTIYARRFYVIKLAPCLDATINKHDFHTGAPLDFMINASSDTLVTVRNTGKFALCDNTIGGATEINSTDSFVVDFLGYGNVNATHANYPGDCETMPNNGMSVKKILRRVNPIVDNNNNNTDFDVIDIEGFNDIVRYNTNTTLELNPVISFSHTAGYYESSFNLEITDETVGSGTAIYYTTDGSDPSTSQTRIPYTGSIVIKDRTGDQTRLMDIPGTSTTKVGEEGYFWPPYVEGSNNVWAPMAPIDQKELFDSVFKINTIRAVAETPQGRKSDTITGSFIVSSIPQAERFALPIISVITDADNLYDDEIGLFKNPEGRGADWQRPIYTEFFETDGSMAFNGDMGLRINGGYTRNYPQKALRFYATSGTLNYDLFQGNAKKHDGSVLTAFDRFILRSSGNDWRSSAIRDSLWHTYTKRLNSFDIQEYRPCVAFINGEFWGMYDIRERYDNDYFANHYDMKKGDVVLLEGILAHSNTSGAEFPSPAGNYTHASVLDNYLSDGNAADLTEFINLRNDIITLDMTESDNYDIFLNEFDVNNFIDYMICVIFSGNTDWPHNNVKIWKNKGASTNVDNRWRFLMVDADFAFPSSSSTPSDHNTLKWAMGQLDNTYPGGEFLASLMENDGFRRQFSARFAYLLDNFFISEDMIEHLDTMQGAVTTAMPEHRERWNLEMSRWQSTTNTIKTRMRERPAAMKKIVYETLDTAIFSCDPKTGTMIVNGVDISDDVTNRYSAAVLAGETVSVSITPKEGYHYLGSNFVTKAGSVTIIESDFTFAPETGGMLTAVFEKDAEMTIAPLISSKFIHTFALNAVGDLYGWGRASESRMSPLSGEVFKPTLVQKGVKKASAGNHHSIFIDKDDIVNSMGRNNYGKVGHGNIDESRGINQVLFNGSSLRAKEIIAGGNHSLAIGIDNKLYGWGYNNHNQINSANTNNVIEPHVIAQNVISAAAGNENTYYVTADKKLYAIGRSSYGMLGGSTGANMTTNVIASDVAAVFASNSEAFYITTGGTLYGFGRNNDSSALGSGVEISIHRELDSDVLHASASQTHLLYVKNDGSVWGQGKNASNQINSANTNDCLTPFKIAENGVMVAAGTGTSHILTKSGSIRVLGSTQYRNENYGLSENGINTPMELNTVTPIKNAVIDNGVVSADFANYSGISRILQVYDVNRNDNHMLGLEITPMLFSYGEEATLDYNTKHSGGKNKVLIWEGLRPILSGTDY